MLEATYDWAGLRSIALIVTLRDDSSKQTLHQRYYTSSLAADAEKFLQASRGHWGIENSLHWQLDITFREDASQVRKDQGAINLHTIRKQALQLLARHPGKMSDKRKRIKVARCIDFFLQKFLNLCF
ncbi:MAG: ISAs1 family transposase [Cyclobacteriaceae bacterium]